MSPFKIKNICPSYDGSCLFQAQNMLILFEHASGYALFRVKEFEEVGMLLPEVEAGIGDLSRFQSVVKLAAFSPFKSGTNALDNINSISEGMCKFIPTSHWVPCHYLHMKSF